MNFQQEIRILASHLHSNAVNINSSGLYAGKAGVALALFEAAHFLRDNEMEDVAFALLQEALISNTDDIGFENGLSGRGLCPHLLDTAWAYRWILTKCSAISTWP